MYVSNFDIAWYCVMGVLFGLALSAIVIVEVF